MTGMRPSATSSPHRPHRVRWAALAVVLAAAGGCFGGPPSAVPPAGAGGEASTSAARAVRRVMITGVARVPRVISDMGAGVISNNSSSLVSDHGAGLIGKVKWRVLATADADLIPVPRARVRAFDAKGQPTAAAETTTDDQGRFTLIDVPPGANVVVRITGARFELTSLARPFVNGPPVLVDHATTLLTAHLLGTLRGKPDQLAQLPIGRFGEQADAVAAATRTEDVTVALQDESRARASFDALAARRADLAKGAGTLIAEAATALTLTPGKAGGDELPPSPRAGAAGLVDFMSPLASPGPAPSGDLPPGTGGDTGLASPAPSAPPTEASPTPAPSEGPTTPAPSGGLPTPAPTAEPTASPTPTPTATPKPSMVTTLTGSGAVGAGDGVRTAASFTRPMYAAYNGILYVTDAGSHTLRAIDAAGTVSTVAGAAGAQGLTDGGKGVSRLNTPMGMAVEPLTGGLLIADSLNHMIRIFDPGSGAVARVLGSNLGTAGYADGAQDTARFNGPVAIAASGVGRFFVADAGNHCIRSVAFVPPNSYATSTHCGTPTRTTATDGLGAAAGFGTITDMVADVGGILWVADSGSLRRVDGSGDVKTIALTVSGGGTCAVSGLGIDPAAGALYASSTDGGIFQIVGTVATRLTGGAGYVDGPAPGARFTDPFGMVVNASQLFVCDAGNRRIRRVDLQ